MPGRRKLIGSELGSELYLEGKTSCWSRLAGCYDFLQQVLEVRGTDHFVVPRWAWETKESQIGKGFPISCENVVERIGMGSICTG